MFLLYSPHLSPLQSPEVPNGTFRDCKRSPSSRASPDFGSSPIQKKVCRKSPQTFCILYMINALIYIIPIPPAPPAGIAGTSSLIVATTDSVVKSVDATLVAFCKALLVTLAGSRIPLLTISTYSSA